MEQKNKKSHNLLILFAAIALLVIISQFYGKPDVSIIKFSDFISAVEKGKVKSVVVEGVKISGEFNDGKRFQTTINEQFDSGEFFIKHKGISVEMKEASDGSFFTSLLFTFLPIAILIYFFYRMAKNNGAGGNAMAFGKAKAKRVESGNKKITFADVAGIDEMREELEEVVDYLCGNQRYADLGGRIPKGVLLMGAPGTGKTLLAKAIAGEADVPFFAMSGSEFVEMFVGVGASRVRDLFEQAKKNAPCIIFIDEIDAMGKHRGTGVGGGNDEREQTLNQILVEMDGIDANEGVILIAATNRPDVLDPGLLRPGRFDRKIIVPRPDMAGRAAILKVHTKRKKLDSSVDLVKIAQKTPGMTGADLENITNEAALSAGRKKQKAIFMEDFEEAVDKVLMGKKMNRKMVEKERENTAYHEAGHALMMLECKESSPLHKVSIEPRSNGALGVTFSFPKDDVYTYTKSQLSDMVLVVLGGRAAEEIIFGKNQITTGASNDLERATKTVRDMISKWSMDEESGLGVFDNSHTNPFLGKELAMGSGVSQGMQEKIENRTNEILKDSYDKVIQILTARKNGLQKLAQALLAKETLSAEEVMAVLEDGNSSLVPKD
ncbi:MAG: ATP-dependent zinc metalloprotease FtsH [Patescibacteria group bacterium]